MHQKQHTLWLLAALAAPLAHFSGCGWLSAGAAAAAALPLMLLPKDWERPLGPVVLAQLVSLGAVAGTLLQYSAVYWPSDNALAVPLVLLALAALTGNAAAPRIGALLALCMALTAVPAAVSGAAKAEPAWLRPTVEAWPWMLSLVLLLANLPAADRGKRSVGAVGILAVLPQVGNHVAYAYHAALKRGGTKRCDAGFVDAAGLDAFIEGIEGLDVAKTQDLLLELPVVAQDPIKRL